MTANEEQEHRRRHGRHALIPAGLLIGLGAGLITGYPWSGALIGLGLGFLAQGFLKSAGGPVPDPAAPWCSRGSGLVSAIIGIFMIVIGVSIIWAPVHLWPYVIGFLLILLGIVFAVKSMWKSS